MLKTNIKLALRSLTKNRGFSLINILGLAVGMAVAIMIGLWVHDELTFDHMHANKDRLAQVKLKYFNNGEYGVGEAMALPMRAELSNNFSEDFEEVSFATWNGSKILMVGDKKIIRRGMSVEPHFLDMLDVPLTSGDRSQAFDEIYSIIINESIAKALFGTNNPMGKVIKIDDRNEFKVTGIFKDFPKNSSWQNVTLFMPWAAYAQREWVKNNMNDWDDHSHQIFTLLHPDADIAAVNQRIKNVEARHHEDDEVPTETFIHEMSKWHLHGNFQNGENTGGRIQFVWLFSIIGIFVLLLACINFMNLSTAQSERRAKEVGVRKTVGSGRSELIAQFLTESYLIVGISALIALMLVQLTLPTFNQLADKDMSILWSNPVFLVAILGFILITGLLAGSYPAFFLSSFEPLRVLKNTFGTGRAASTPRKVLVVLQFTVSIALIIGTLVVFQQINHAKDRQLGYDNNGIIQVMMLTPEIREKFDLVRDNLLKTGVVKEVSHSNSPMTNIWSNTGGMKWKGYDPNASIGFANTGVSHEYGETINWNIVDGRDFSRELKTDTASMILNEAAVAIMGLENPVGETVYAWNKEPYTVIGVVKDILQDSPYLPVKPSIYRLDPERRNMMFIRMQPETSMQMALNKIGGVFKSVLPATPFDYEFVDESFGEKFESEERIGKLARIFAILAIFISCLGLFGLSAYVAERRTKEIGIRKVLGASVLDLWAMLSKDFILLVLIACLVAVPIAWYYLNGWLESYEYRITLSWWVFVSAGILAVVVTLATVSFQSIKAALTSPIESLKDE